MVHLEDLDIPFGPEHACRSLDQVRQKRNAKRSIGGAQDGDFFCSCGDTAAGEVVEAGGSDEYRYARRDGAIKACLKRRRSREIDKHVSPIGVDLETGILRNRFGNGTPHPPVGSEKADPGGLFVGAHAPVA
jgi:hypothetical protein